MHSHNRTLIAKLGFADPDKKLPRHDLGCQYVALPEQHEKIVRMCLNASVREPDALERFIVRAADGALVLRRIPDGSLRSNGDTWVSASELALLRERLGPGPRPDLWQSISGRDVLSLRTPRLEHVVQKGSGAYATTVGFLDAVLPAMTADKSISVAVSDGAPTPPRAPGVSFPEMLLEALLNPKPRDPNQETIVTFSYRQSARSKPEEVVVEVKITPVPIGDVLRQLNMYREYYRASGWVVATDYDVTAEDATLLAREEILHIRLGAGFDRYVAGREVTKRVASASPEI